MSSQRAVLTDRPVNRDAMAPAVSSNSARGSLTDSTASLSLNSVSAGSNSFQSTGQPSDSRNRPIRGRWPRLSELSSVLTLSGIPARTAARTPSVTLDTSYPGPRHAVATPCSTASTDTESLSRSGANCPITAGVSSTPFVTREMPHLPYSLRASSAMCGLVSGSPPMRLTRSQWRAIPSATANCLSSPGSRPRLSA